MSCRRCMELIRGEQVISRPCSMVPLFNMSECQPSLPAVSEGRRAGAQQVGRIHCAVFSDAALFAEVASKAAFWQQDNYYGVDLTRLLQPAVDDYFAQVC